MQVNISNSEIATQIRVWESVSFECKETLNKEIKEKLSTYFAAFANTSGGLFIIGVNNSKETVGYSLKKGDREYISEQAKNCRPQVQINIEEERDYDNHKIVLIYVHKSDNKIHIDNKYRFPIRVGSNIDYLDITGLIPLAKERLGLDYATTKPEILLRSSSFEERVKTKAKPEEIELCLKAVEWINKEARLQGLREIELLSYKRQMFDEDQILEALEELLNDKEAEIRKKVIEILSIMISSEDDESRQKLIDRYSNQLINIAKADSNLEARSEAIRILVEMNNKHVIEIIIEITIQEKDELFNRIKSSGFRNLVEETKLEIKNKLIEELNNSKQSENIKNRIIEILEIIRMSGGFDF
ncbi:Putative DNA-binding domain protein [uncultured archaeon]|nr:Putative DNA-binding domain protein [uncultured archaeon]